MLYANHGIVQTFPCKWEDRDGAKYFTYEITDPTGTSWNEGMAWAWLLHEGVLLHPGLTVYTKQ